MSRLKVDFYKVCGAFPEAEQIRVLPRKKKKALKKKIGQMESQISILDNQLNNYGKYAGLQQKKSKVNKTHLIILMF